MRRPTKALFAIVWFVVVGTLLAYMAGREYCFNRLNIRAIYDEAPAIPPDIADGSAHGSLWAVWGAVLSGALGL